MRGRAPEPPGEASGGTAHAHPFIGRGGYLTRLAELHRQGERLVTLHGAAGMGKTRLAREHARRLEAGSEVARVVFVDLATSRTLDDVGAALADAIAAPRTAVGPAEAIVRALARLLRDRGPALVILDNFEQLVGEASAVVGPLHDAGLALLVTSREILRLGGETVIELEPLSLPGADAATSEAMDLLLDRVERAHGSAGGDPAVYGDIVRELDGIPLALELAAPRIALIGAAAFRERLGRRLDVLAEAPRDAARHQRTLRGAIDHSWDLLDEAEQRTLAQCAVFRGAFDLEAFEEVVDAGAARRPLDVLHSLRDKSLVPRAAVEGGVPYFSLYLSIREHAAERLAQDPALAHATCRRHAAFYARCAEALAEQVDTVRGAEALDRLARVRDNVLALVEHAIETRATDLVAFAAQATLALASLVFARGPIPPLLRLVDELLGILAETPPADPGLRAELLVLRGRCLHGTGRFDAAIDTHRAALAAAEALGARGLAAIAYGELTTSASRRNGPEDALAMYAGAARRHAELGDARREGIALRRASVFLRELGRLGEARAAASRSVQLLHEAAAPAWEALGRTELAYIALEEGDLRTARREAEHALVSATGSGNWLHASLIRGMLGLVCLAEGTLEECIDSLESALANHVLQVAAARYEGQARAYHGIALLERGDVTAATDSLERALALLRGVDERRYRGPFGAFLGAARAAGGDHDGASALLAEAAALAEAGAHRACVVDVLAAVVRVSRAAAGGSLDASHAVARAATHEIAAATARATHGHAAFDLRLALRYARRVLGPLGLTAAPVTEGGARPAIVDRRADWLELPSGERAAVGRRGALRLLLLALVRQRIDAPGLPLAATELVERGWPGELIRPTAAKNRLAVALAALRKLGLRGLLMSDVRGYFLDPSTPFVWADEISSGGAR